MGSGLMAGGFDGWRGVSSSGAGSGPPPVADTLASIYAYGLSDDPAADNIMAMPDGEYSFAGTGGSQSNSWNRGFFEHPHVFDLSSTCTNSYTQLWLDFTTLGSRTFQTYGLNDPLWNGVFPSLGGIEWETESIAMGANAADSISRTSDIRVAINRWGDAGPRNWTVPDPGPLPNAKGMYRSTWLYNHYETLAEVHRINPFGMVENIVRNLQGGATAGFLTHWNTDIVGSVAGDGPTWWIDKRGRIEDFQPTSGLQAYQVTNDIQMAWGWRMWTWDGATNLISVDITPTLGVAAIDWQAHSFILDNEDSTTYPFGPATKAKLIWDNALSELRISQSGAAYTDVLLGTTQANGAQAAIFGTNLGPTNLTSLTPTLWAVTKINGAKYSFPLWPTT